MSIDKLNDLLAHMRNYDGVTSLDEACDLIEAVRRARGLAGLSFAVLAALNTFALAPHGSRIVDVVDKKLPAYGSKTAELMLPAPKVPGAEISGDISLQSDAGLDELIVAASDAYTNHLAPLKPIMQTVVSTWQLKLPPVSEPILRKKALKDFYEVLKVKKVDRARLAKRRAIDPDW